MMTVLIIFHVHLPDIDLDARERNRTLPPTIFFEQLILLLIVFRSHRQ